jgi:adenine deaminase
MRGGIAKVMDGALLASLPLPVAGLMSDAPVLEVAEAFRTLWELSKSVYTISEAIGPGFSAKSGHVVHVWFAHLSRHYCRKS